MSEPLEIATVQASETATFWKSHEREALQTHWGFRIIWHEQRHEFCVRTGDEISGALSCTIAASLASIEALAVEARFRLQGVGRALLARCEETANYYNCHKVTVQVRKDSGAQAFFLACGYHVEAVLPQHTFKLDVTVLRKFLL